MATEKRVEKAAVMKQDKADKESILISGLLEQLTLEEKIRMIHGDALFYSGDVKRLQIPALHMSDGPMGVRQEFPKANWVPVGNSDDYVTYCPSNSAIASTWNRDLAYQAGQVMGEEARGRGKDMLLAPGINIKRVPANGRNFEYMSEDPYLISEMVVPLIRGIQESDVAACVKHFALNNQETERLWVNVEVDERALREIYLPGFEAAVRKAGSRSVMGAYNLFRGKHCCENEELLGKILRQEWGYDGVVVSDWGAVHDTIAAGNSPLDLEMSVTYDFDQYKMAEPLLLAVKQGKVPVEKIDEKVRHLLQLMLRLHLLHVGEKTARKAGCYNTPEHRTAVRAVAQESIVLLKNEEKLLPIDREKLQEILVIGDNAERLHAGGGGSAEIKALYEISPLMGIKSQLGGNVKVAFTRGYYVTPKEETQTNWQENSTKEDQGQNAIAQARQKASDEIREKQDQLRREAVNMAASYQTVLLFVGLNHEYDVEGFDRDTMKLPYRQDQLIQEVLAANPDTIVIMTAGNAVEMGTWKDRARAIVWNWYSGMEGGNALTDVLFGKINPSGKLPESIPFRMEDCGALALGEYPGRELTAQEKTRMNAHTTQTYRDGIYVGYRYYEKYQVPVQFCFGHGLSYTSFQYTEASVQTAETTDESLEAVIARVSVKVRNTGERAGKEIIQVYVGKKDSTIDRAVKELRGFTKITLAPGEEKKTEMELTRRAFTYYSTEKHAFVTEPGQYEIYIGKSLQDIVQVLSFTVKA